MVSGRINTRQNKDTYPTRHKTKTTETRTDTEGTLTTELDSDQTERLVTRRDQSEIGTAEQVRRKRSELGLRVHTVRVQLHQASKLLRSEPTVEINDGTDGNELNGGLLLEPNRASVNVDPLNTNGRSTYNDGMTSAIKSTPFCLDQRPTNTKRSAFGSCLIPAHSCA